MSELYKYATLEEKADHFVSVIDPKTVVKTSTNELSLVSDRKIKFDDHLCKRLLACAELPFKGMERPLRPNWVNYLISAMHEGTFHPEWVHFVTCQVGNVTYRCNGQHTILARLEMPNNWVAKNGIDVVQVQAYESRGMDGLRELYASIDRGAPRTKSNQLSALLIGTKEYEDVSPTLLKLACEGLSLWLWELKTQQKLHGGNEIAHIMRHTHAALVTSVLSWAASEPKLLSLDFLRRAPVMGAMYETFGKVYSASVTFWDSVRSGVGFDSPDDPRLRLRNALQNTVLMSDATISKKKNSVNRETMYRWCVAAFNAWRAGEVVKVLRTPKTRQRAK